MKRKTPVIGKAKGSGKGKTKKQVCICVYTVYMYMYNVQLFQVLAKAREVTSRELSSSLLQEILDGSIEGQLV